ncbi:hypothetical protein G9A89_000778 [Geosiphon pyriformis]|nr:hypothetical protein G9A89_000778 [Geosiphon pyriformis]
MCKILMKVVASAADETFSKLWFRELDCAKNKLSSKFFQLELLVAKIVKCLVLKQDPKVDHLINIWTVINEAEANKGKEKLQTPAVIPRRIQLLMWKKQKIESLLYLSYYHTLRSTINITLTNTSTSTMTLTFGQLPFQSKQKKAELLETYSNYFERFKSQLPTPSEF